MKTIWALCYAKRLSHDKKFEFFDFELLFEKANGEDNKQRENEAEILDININVESNNESDSLMMKIIHHET